MLCMILMGGGSVKAEKVDFGPNWNTVFGTSYDGTIKSVSQHALSLEGSVNGVKLTVNNGTSTNGYVKTSDFRVYNGYTMIFEAPSGYVITEMSSTKGGKTFSSGISASVGSLSISNNQLSWHGFSNSVVLSMSGTVSFATITVTYVDENTLASPVLSLPEGTYWSNQVLEIGVPTNADGVKYTKDGSNPKDSQTAVTITSATSIDITQTTTIKAIAYKGSNYSEEVSRTYTFVSSIANTKENAYTTAQAIKMIDKTSSAQLAAEKVYVKGVVSKVESYSDQYKSITYWLDDNTFEVYSGKGLGLSDNDFNAVTDIEVGAKVVICGNVKKYNNTYEFDKNNYLVEYTAPSKLSLEAQQGENYYATFSSNKAVKFVDAEVYAVNVDGDALKFNAVDSKEVPANTGVLIKTTSTTTSYYEVEANGTISDNMLKASSVAMSDSDKNYKLAYNDYSAKTGLGFYYGAANGGVFTPKTNGAYLAVPLDQTSARCFTFDDVETGINTIEVADEANTATEVYDLAGRKVSKAQKGLYIVNGIKVIK